MNGAEMLGAIADDHSKVNSELAALYYDNRMLKDKVDELQTCPDAFPGEGRATLGSKSPDSHSSNRTLTSSPYRSGPSQAAARRTGFRTGMALRWIWDHREGRDS